MRFLETHEPPAGVAEWDVVLSPFVDARLVYRIVIVRGLDVAVPLGLRTNRLIETMYLQGRDRS